MALDKRDDVLDEEIATPNSIHKGSKKRKNEVSNRSGDKNKHNKN